MTADQWEAAVALLAANWPHSLPPDGALAKWRTDLDDLPPTQVMVAIETLYRTGAKFCPNGAQIRAEVVAQVVDAPDFARVWAWISDAIARYPFSAQVLANAWLSDLHPLAGTLAELLDWRDLRYGEGPATVKEAQVRGKWEALVGRCQREAAIAGLPSAGLRELERVNAGPQLIGNPLKLIEGGE